MAQISFGILTVSDSCYAKTKQDSSGPKLVELVQTEIPNGFVLFKDLVPDDRHLIEQKLVEWSSKNCNVILTTGGTGFSPRDVTPEATKSVIDREAPAVTYAITSKSLAVTNFAMLSRAVCGIRNKTLIINFPGSLKGASECFSFVKDIIPHAVSIINDNKKSVVQAHQKIQRRSNSPSRVKICKPADRKRESPYPMLEVSEALELIFKECLETNEIEVVDVNNALNRILAEDIHAGEPLPPFPASIKDGYAVKSSDGAGIRRVKDAVAAGDKPSSGPLIAGEVVRISTGAPVPEGADAVVQVEDTELVEASADGSKELRVKIKVAPKVGQDIRPIGSDIKAGSLVLVKGDRITIGHIGVLATIGTLKAKVYRRPKIGLLSTGNEVQEPGEDLQPGHIRDSNKLTLLNLLRQYSFEAADFGLVRDEPDLMKTALIDAFSVSDVVITTGGVSMGEYDIIKQILIEDFHAKIHFGRVNMKPGKPTTFATCNFDGKHKTIFGLPGNPVSATVTGILFVLPALKHFERNKQRSFTKMPVSLGADLKLDPRPEYVRVALKREVECELLRAYPTGDQMSSRINSFIGANGLLVVPGRNTGGFGDVCRKGDVLEAFLIDPVGVV